MTNPNVAVRLLITDDKSKWHEMWSDYLAFYKQSLGPEITNETWRRFFDDTCTMYCSIAEDDRGQTLGFAIYVTHPGSWGIGDVCYLEDLYVTPEARCKGVARKLIEQLIALGKQNNWYRVYWHTDDGNHTARALYDKIGTLSDRVKYDVPL